ncbi:hypothetical protein [Actinomyces oris]|uniref:hypothetical protein n=1 Tax=Actinomyces oris TaxID=544580 RepID=UPI0026EAD2A8|nr:hypothetical protein [Actinomyces oris]
MSTVDRTANPYEIGVAYVDGKPLGKVSRSDFVEETKDTGLLRTIMEKFFVEESLALSALSYCKGGYEITLSDDRERNRTIITIGPAGCHP